MTDRSTIPVHILTGFLGSGKTTLLNRALASGLGAETAVIVNEFGEIGLDQLFIQERSEETIVLKSGCICCSVRTDLASTLMQLAAARAAGRYQFTRIVVETSGLSDPVPILSTLRSDFNLLTRFHIGAILCVVDATAPVATRERPESLSQLAAADACILSKVDLAGTAGSKAAEEWVATLNPTAALLPAKGAAAVSWIERQEGPEADPSRALLDLTIGVSRRDTSHGVRSLVLRTTASHCWPRFAVWLSALTALHGDRILRMKGILHDEDRATWVAVNGVRRFLAPPEHLTLKNPPPGGACLVFITDGLDPALIERSYRARVLREEPEQAGSGDGAPRAELPDAGKRRARLAVEAAPASEAHG